MNSFRDTGTAPAEIFPRFGIDPLRAGIGLRTQHYQEMLESRPAVSFIEVHSENYFGAGGQPLAWLERLRRNYPLSLHGVGLSLGGAGPLDRTHLAKLKRLADRFEPALVSDHICWVGVDGNYLNDLLPLPYTEESLDHLVRRVHEAQEFLGRPILVENVSAYLQFSASTIPEWEFVAELVKRCGCGLLFDVNNMYVNSVNHGFDPVIYLDAIAPDSVREIHLAGFDRIIEDDGEICLIDTHCNPVCDDVWKLFEQTTARFGPVPTVIEWDTDIPPLPTLLREAERATRILTRGRERVA